MSSVDGQIRSLLRETSQLERQIDSARAQYRAAREKLNNYERRRREVQSVKNKMSSSFDGAVSSIQRNQDQMKDKVANATSGLRRESALTSAVARDREKHTESDGVGGQIHSNLQSEINRCAREIEAARREMNEADGRATSLANQRTSAVNRAKSLAKDDDATVKVYVGARY